MTRLAWRELAATGLMTCCLSCGSLPPSESDGGNALAGKDDGHDGGTNIGQGGPDDGGTAPSGDGGAPLLTCPDLFAQDVLQTYSVDISADEWAKMDAEFHNIPMVLTGQEFQTYHPITLHLGAETVTDAAIRLKGQSSWVQTVQLDAHPKMQFVIAFDSVVPTKTFHGVSKLGFDMPRSDLSFMHERLANNWLREIGIMAPCSNSARIVINGSYYGVYVQEESVGHHLLKEFFPLNSDGDMWKGGSIPQTNLLAPNTARKNAFWAATSIASMLQVIDLQHSVLEWAADALLNNGDGYYGGAHNYYIYDQGLTEGWVWLPADTDATFDWLGFATDHPIYWWEQRHGADPPAPHWLAVMSDPTWRGHYVEAIRTQLQRWDVAAFQARIDTWSKQIADAVNTDPNKAATSAQFQSAVALARKIVAERPAYMQSFLDCEDAKSGADQDGDGVRWCNDCRDDLASVHPGAPEICNGIDDNCNGVVDEGCSGP